MNVMGLKPIPYWVGTFITDYLGYLTTVLFFYILVLFHDIPFIDKHLNKIILILASFGCSIITFTYCFGFLFKNSNTAFKSFPIISFFGMYSVPWILMTIFNSNGLISSILKLLVYTCSPYKVLENALTSVNSDFNLFNKSTFTGE